MSYIMHTESGQKFEIDGKTAEEVKSEIKNAGLTIGNVTVARLVDGSMTQASGFERIESLSEEEQQEQDRALAEAETHVDLKANEEQQAQQADTNQTTAPGVVTGGQNSDNAESNVKAPANTIQEIAPNLPNPVDAPHDDKPEGLAPTNVTKEGKVRSPESSVTEPAADPIVTTSNDIHTESTLTQPTNADGTVAAPDVAATDVNNVNEPAPSSQLGQDLAHNLNPDNAAAEQQTEVRQQTDEEILERTNTSGKVEDGAVAHGLDDSVKSEEASVLMLDPTQENEVAKDPAIEKRVEASVDPEEVRRRMLGNNVAEALKESEAADGKDDAARAAADQKLKAASVTPKAEDKERKRRHNKREDTIEEARQGKHGDMIKSIEDGVTPKLELNYVNPDQRWFEFTIVDKADASKPNARTNAYVDLSPLKEGGYQFGLYVNGKSMKSTIGRVRVAAGEDVVKAVNDFLADALPKAGI